jgi:UPF0716 protein FxsA
LIPLILLAYFVIELLALVGVVRLAGALGTFMLAALASTSGYLLVRGEGLALASRLARFVRRAQATGEVPPLPLAESLPRLIAGLLLIVPGFAKDVLAILILLPPLRGWVVRRVHGWVAERHHRVLRERGIIIDIEGEVLPGREGPPPGPPPREPPPAGPRWLPPPQAS